MTPRAAALSVLDRLGYFARPAALLRELARCPSPMATAEAMRVELWREVGRDVDLPGAMARRLGLAA